MKKWPEDNGGKQLEEISIEDSRIEENCKRNLIGKYFKLTGTETQTLYT